MTTTAYAMSQARAGLDAILEMTEALNTEDDDAREQAEETIREYPVEAGVPHTYFILIATGGPAVRIVGELDNYNAPATARLECQDWLTPWVRVATSTDEDTALLTFASLFDFSYDGA